MVGTRSGASADAAWSTPAIIAETISFGPEVLLIAAVALLVAVLAMVAYLVGGYVAIYRVAAGSRSTRAVIGTALAVLVGAYLVVVPLINGEPWMGSLVPPAIHGVAAWRGRRHAQRAREAVPPPPSPPPGPPSGPPAPPPPPPRASG